jgi:hypothetical protein
MRSSSRSFVLLALCAAIPSLATAQQPTPAVLVRVRSLDALQVQGATLFDQLGLAKTFGQLDALLKTKAGPKGLAGIDTAKPVGAFVHFTPDPAWAVLIPITGEAAFLDLLERLDYKTSLGKDGIRTFPLHPLAEASLKFDRGYAWITLLNRNAFRTTFDAASLLTSGGPLASGRVRLDLMPKDARQLLTAEFEEWMQEALKTMLKSADKEGPKEVTTAVFQELPRRFAQILDEGKELVVDIDFEPVPKELRVQARLDPLPGTALAKSLAEMGQRKNAFPAAGDAALTANIGASLPTPIAKALTKLVVESFQDAQANFTDASRKEKSQALLDALRPTFEAGNLVGQLRFVGPSADRKLGMALFAEVKDGVRLAATVREMLDDAKKQMPAAEQAKVELDADTADSVKIHRFRLPAEPGRAEDVLGQRILSLGFGPDGLWMGLGAGSGEALKTMATAKRDADGKVFALDLDAARLSPLLAPKADPKTFFTTRNDGLIRLQAEAGPAFRIDLSIHTPVLRFLNQTRDERP